MKEDVRRIVGDGGMRIMLEHIPHVRSCSLGVWVNRGSRHEPVDKIGISHFLEHMMFKGTSRRTAKQIASSIESVGGSIDAFTGSEIWNTDEDIVGTFLSYSDRHDVLIQTGSYNRDRASDEVKKGMVAYRGVDGSVLWKNLELAYQGPCLMWRDKIITNGATGFKLDLFTGEKTGWEFSRMYGCNAIIGSENLLTFRSGAAGFCDLAGDSGTGNLGGFKSSCTSNLIVADGVLNAPDYTRTCTCAYQNQTSLAFIHMPDEDQWTFNAGKRAEIDDRVGLNLGAPGDRRGPNGTLWLDMPKVGGPSPAGVYVEFKPEKPEWFSRHTSEMEGEGLKWVAASGGLGIETLTVKFGEEPKKEDEKKKDEKEKDKKDEKPEKKEPPRPERPHRVTLHFAEPEHLEPGERVFTVSLQGEPVLEDFDIVEAAGGSNRAVVREFSGISVGSELVITLTPTGKSKKRLPILCGVELVADGK